MRLPVKRIAFGFKTVWQSFAPKNAFPAESVQSLSKRIDYIAFRKEKGRCALFVQGYGKNSDASLSACLHWLQKVRKICKFDAIHVIDNHAVIDYDKCRSCGLCVKECPKQCIVKQVGKRPAVVKPKTDAEPAKPAAQN